MPTHLKLKITPGAKKDQVLGWEGDTLRLKVAAPPVEGKANRQVEALLAELLGLKKRQVKIVKGEKSRDKTAAIEGMSLDEARARLEA